MIFLETFHVILSFSGFFFSSYDIINMMLFKYKSVSVIERLFGPCGIPKWVDMVLQSINCSMDNLPDNVLFNIINHIETLQDLLNACLVSQRWYDLGQYRFHLIKHLIGKSQAKHSQSIGFDTLIFNTDKSVPSPSTVSQFLPNLKTIIIQNDREESTKDNSDENDDDEVEKSKTILNNQQAQTKGFYLSNNYKLILFEPKHEPELNDCEVIYLKRFLNLLNSHGEFVETLTILTLDCDQLELFSSFIAGDHFQDDVTQLTIGIPVWYDFRYVTCRCPRLKTLYYLVRDSWNLVNHHQFDSIQQNSLQNLFLEFWVNDNSHVDIEIYVKMFPKLRQLAIRDHPNLDDNSVYRLLVSLRYLDNLDVRGSPNVSVSSTERVVWKAQCDLPHRINYFCGPYQRQPFIRINSHFIFTSWKIGSINPFDLYSPLARQILLTTGQQL